MLKEIASDYADRLVTPVYVGIRKGYLNPENEETVRALGQGLLSIRRSTQQKHSFPSTLDIIGTKQRDRRGS
ncbi:hypothetical protein B6U67_05990 [Methanosarcinales archaeon ex4484_138]|nr:MAG: hypothetical protein B6U67_05990 [Methanosarcinales archaeon ex4484_138]